MRASSPVSAATATRKKVVECRRRGYVGHGTGACQEACERALAYRLTDAKPITYARLPRKLQKSLRPYDLIEANLRLSSQRRTQRRSSRRRLPFRGPSPTSQSPSQDSPKASITYLGSPSLPYPVFLLLAYPVNSESSPLFWL